MSRFDDHDLSEERADQPEIESEDEVSECQSDHSVTEIELTDLEEALAEKEHFKNLLQRTQADFVNYRKRSASQIEEARFSTKRRLILRVLEVMDSLQAALKNDAISTVENHWVEGIRVIQRSFESLLASEGVVAFKSVGDRFDPRIHEAVTKSSAEGFEPDTVIDVLRIGYKINDDILRPAMVVVSGSDGAENVNSSTVPD